MTNKIKSYVILNLIASGGFKYIIWQTICSADAEINSSCRLRLLTAKLFENQLKLMKQPVCRNGKTDATVGLQQKIWETWK